MNKHNILIILIILVIFSCIILSRNKAIDYFIESVMTYTRLKKINKGRDTIEVPTTIIGLTTTTSPIIVTTTTIVSTTTTNNKICELENCHGLDIKCGPNPRNICTLEYAMGDRCLQYAKCGIQKDKCQQILNPQFSECKSCIQACINNNTNDSAKMFECESTCK